MAGDQVNPNRMWAVAPGGADASYTSYTQDGWASSSIFGISDEGGYLNQTPYDVAQAGGTVIAAGDAGMIIVSTDGVNFRHQPASGSQATAGWRAVSLASASDAAVGGQGGQLAVSSDANVFPAPAAATPTPVATSPSPTPAAPVLTPVSATPAEDDDDRRHGHHDLPARPRDRPQRPLRARPGEGQGQAHNPHRAVPEGQDQGHLDAEGRLQGQGRPLGQGQTAGHREARQVHRGGEGLQGPRFGPGAACARPSWSRSPRSAVLPGRAWPASMPTPHPTRTSSSSSAPVATSPGASCCPASTACWPPGCCPSASRSSARDATHRTPTTRFATTSGRRWTSSSPRASTRTRGRRCASACASSPPPPTTATTSRAPSRRPRATSATAPAACCTSRSRPARRATWSGCSATAAWPSAPAW